MSDAQEYDVSHDGPIRTPKQLVAVVVASFVVPVIVIILLVNFVDFGEKAGAGSTGMSPEAVARRLQPVGTVEIRDLSNPAAARTGEQVYQAQCSACHATGAANAPKLGDAAAWAPRVKTGFESLLNSAMKGKGAMAPQGGGDFSDHEVARAVVYIANQGGGKLAEPATPAPAAAAASVPK
jgi:cytochrome c5